jgi:HAD superfamily hydrolase (TIGR01509 family)
MTKMLYVSDLDGTLVRSVFQNELVVNVRLLETLKSLKPVSYLALVTSASRKTCVAILNQLGLDGFFDHVVTADDVDFIKPHPEGYINCIEYFGVKPEHTMVFEDTRGGAEAAKGAGAMVCLVEW